MRKIFYCLCAVILFGMVASAAKADDLDFKLQVLDPPAPVPGEDSYTVKTITNLSTFYPTFGDGSGGSNCPYGNGPDADGKYDDGTYCFVGHNETGALLTSLTITVPDNPGLADQTATCPTSNVFGAAVCTSPTLSDDDFTLYFSISGENGIPNGGYFILAETETDASGNPIGGPNDFIGSSVIPGIAPEPGSMWLLSTAAALMGGLLFTRRRWIHSGLL